MEKTNSTIFWSSPEEDKKGLIKDSKEKKGKVQRGRVPGSGFPPLPQLSRFQKRHT